MTGEQQAAFKYLRELAEAHSPRYRVKADPEGFPIIPGKYGQIEWYGVGTLAVYTMGAKTARKLLALRGVQRHQVGDTETRALFALELLPMVASIISARYRRPAGGPRPEGFTVWKKEPVSKY